jgi:hypothetical protein
MTLSVDIGREYLAWAYLFENSLTYGIYNFETEDKPRGCAEFLSSFPYTHLFVERQMAPNWRCSQIQHFLQGASAAGSDATVEIQDAREKFKKLGVVCDTRGKAHKRLSVDLALDWINYSEGLCDDSEVKLKDYEKQDDISDAVNMLRPN